MITESPNSPKARICEAGHEFHMSLHQSHVGCEAPKGKKKKK